MSATISVPTFWTFRLPCGRPFGSLVADQRPYRIVATEADAWREFFDSKRDGDAARRSGKYVTADDEFDTARWNLRHSHPDCSLITEKARTS